LAAAGGPFELVGVVLSRSLELRRDGAAVATIAPDHMFTRRASIEAHAEVSIEVLLFAFWLAAMCWKREADNAS
jgi:hypothetical protein